MIYIYWPEDLNFFIGAQLVACQVWRSAPGVRRPEGKSLLHQFSTLNLENTNRGCALSNQSIYRTPVQRYFASQEWEVTNTLKRFKIILSVTIGSISIKLGKKHPCVKGTQVYSKKVPFNSLKKRKWFFILIKLVITGIRSCRGYNVFDPSVSPSVCQFVSPVFIF